MVQKFDAFLIEVCETSLNFLNGLVGITQRQVEKTLHKTALGWAGLTILVSVYQTRQSKAYILTVLLVALNMWLMDFGFKVKMRSSNQARALDRYEGAWIRFCSLLPTFLPAFQIAVSAFKGWSASTVWNLCFGMIYVTEFVFVYVIVCNVEGEKGRQAKMAWDKIKELFGTEWIPQPVGVGR